MASLELRKSMKFGFPTRLVITTEVFNLSRPYKDFFSTIIAAIGCQSQGEDDITSINERGNILSRHFFPGGGIETSIRAVNSVNKACVDFCARNIPSHSTNTEMIHQFSPCQKGILS